MASIKTRREKFEGSVEERLRQIFVQVIGCADEEVIGNANIVLDLGADSLDVMECLMTVEEEFGLEFGEDVEFDAWGTFEVWVKVVSGLMSMKGKDLRDLPDNLEDMAENMPRLNVIEDKEVTGKAHGRGLPPLLEKKWVQELLKLESFSASDASKLSGYSGGDAITKLTKASGIVLIRIAGNKRIKGQKWERTVYRLEVMDAVTANLRKELGVGVIDEDVVHSARSGCPGQNFGTSGRDYETAVVSGSYPGTPGSC